MLIEDKQIQLKQFFSHLQEKYPTQVELVFNGEYDMSRYEVILKRIVISLEDLEIFDFRALSFILAHEYKHALQYSDSAYLKKRTRMMDLSLLMGLLSFFFIIGYVSLVLLRDSKFESFIIVGFLIFFRIFLFLANRESERTLLAEYDADKFANENTGTGINLFEKVIKRHSLSDNGESNQRYNWLERFLGFSDFKTHPNVFERLELSREYVPQEIVLSLEKISKIS